MVFCFDKNVHRMEYKKLISYKRQGSKNREIPSRSLQVHMKINVSFVVWEG